MFDLGLPLRMTARFAIVSRVLQCVQCQTLHVPLYISVGVGLSLRMTARFAIVSRVLECVQCQTLQSRSSIH